MTHNPLIDLDGPVKISRAPFGVDVRAVVEALQVRKASAIYVARDERQAQAALKLALFFNPNLETVLIPGWDNLPYDRTSPSPEAAATRCAGLARLAATDENDTVLFATTGSAIMQRMAPKSVWLSSSLSLSRGKRLPDERLQSFLIVNGFQRVSTVRERGDFAVRGGIVDIFPPEAEEPVRLDFFGDELDTIRTFDPDTQRSTGERPHITLSPASEIFLHEEALGVFRSNYIDAFGTPSGDSMYEAARAGIRRQGLEHWLPLFHKQLATMADVAPQNALWVFADLSREAATERAEQARDYFEARADAVSDGSLRALPPEALYLSPQELEALIASRPAASLAALDADTIANLGGRPGRDFAPERLAGEENIFESVIAHMKAEAEAGRTVVVAGWTGGSTSRLVNVLHDHGAEDIEEVFSFDAARTKRQVVSQILSRRAFHRQI